MNGMAGIQAVAQLDIPYPSRALTGQGEKKQKYYGPQLKKIRPFRVIAD